MAGLSRRQKLISGGAVVSLPFLFAAGIALTPSKLERAGKAIDGDCFTQQLSRDRMRVSANYPSVDCLLTIRAQLVELGFDRGDLEASADGPVRTDRYVMTAGQVDGRGPLLVTIRS